MLRQTLPVRLWNPALLTPSPESVARRELIAQQQKVAMGDKYLLAEVKGKKQ